MERFPPFLGAFLKYGLQKNPRSRPDAALVFDILLNEERSLNWEEMYTTGSTISFLFEESFETFRSKLSARYSHGIIIVLLLVLFFF